MQQGILLNFIIQILNMQSTHSVTKFTPYNHIQPWTDDQFRMAFARHSFISEQCIINARSTVQRPMPSKIQYATARHKQESSSMYSWVNCQTNNALGSGMQYQFTQEHHFIKLILNLTEGIIFSTVHENLCLLLIGYFMCFEYKTKSFLHFNTLLKILLQFTYKCNSGCVSNTFKNIQRWRLKSFVLYQLHSLW